MKTRFTVPTTKGGPLSGGGVGVVVEDTLVPRWDLRDLDADGGIPLEDSEQPAATRKTQTRMNVTPGRFTHALYREDLRGSTMPIAYGMFLNQAGGGRWVSYDPATGVVVTLAVCTPTRRTKWHATVCPPNVSGIMFVSASKVEPSARIVRNRNEAGDASGWTRFQ